MYKLICDKCGKEIKNEDYCSYVLRKHLNDPTEKTTTGNIYINNMAGELCIDCVNRIFAKYETKGEA